MGTRYTEPYLYSYVSSEHKENPSQHSIVNSLRAPEEEICLTMYLVMVTFIILINSFHVTTNSGL